jgi:exopolyphosphatase/guanosine-5'-triphosphate,3'-diphosphate pyrophosphatase
MRCPQVRAVIDIGSNSIKLLVAEFDGHRWVRTLFQTTDETRIGGYLGEGGGGLTEEAVRLGLMSVERLVEQAKPYQPQAAAIVATSAVRDANNRDLFCNLISAATGRRVQVLSGEEEARGIVDGIRCDPGLSDPEHFNLLDQGGGSLEIVQIDGRDVEETSLPLGAVRLFKQFQQGDLGPMHPEARRQIRDLVFELVSSDVGRRNGVTAPWSGTGGALTLTRALLARRDGISIEESSPDLPRDRLEAFFQEIAECSMEERMSRVGVPSSRADILPAGLCAILAVMERTGTESIRHSFFNLRFGVASQLVS